ncbi:MAG: archease [Candidatus Coatesbacteria bacterium]|nr:MAG: archease [Candidatus Coatesbacteria bacterium]
MGKYTFVDHTADVGIEVEAADRPELFSLAARGMFSILCDVEKVKPVRKKTINLVSDDLKGLLHEWLAELLYIFDTEFEVYTEYEFQFGADGKNLTAIARGEDADAERHGLHGEIKNVTWCDYVVEEKPDGSYFSRIVFDL